MATPRVRQVRHRGGRGGLRQHLVRLADHAGDHRHAPPRAGLPDRPATRPFARLGAARPDPRSLRLHGHRPVAHRHARHLRRLLVGAVHLPRPALRADRPPLTLAVSLRPCRRARPGHQVVGRLRLRGGPGDIAALPTPPVAPPGRHGRRAGAARRRPAGRLPGRHADRPLLRELHRLLREGPPHAVAVVGSSAPDVVVQREPPRDPYLRLAGLHLDLRLPAGLVLLPGVRRRASTASSRSATRSCGGPRCRRSSLSWCWPSSGAIASSSCCR